MGLMRRERGGGRIGDGGQGGNVGADPWGSPHLKGSDPHEKLLEHLSKEDKI